MNEESTNPTKNTQADLYEQQDPYAPEGQKAKSLQEYCRECRNLLVPGDNWAEGNVKIHARICKSCHALEMKRRYQIVKQTKEMDSQAKHAFYRTKIRDEERITRLIKRIQDANVEIQRERILSEYRNAAEQNGKSMIDAERAAIEIGNQYTFDFCVEKHLVQPDHLIMAEVLSRNKVFDPKEGDTLNTWHIALHECGYDGYEIDQEGLPLALPGLQRLVRIRQTMNKSDRIKGGTRIGITLAKYLEGDRRSRREGRLVLCRGPKGEEVYGQKYEEMENRRFNESRSMSQLKLRIWEKLADTQSTIDAFVSLYKRIGEP